MSRGLAALLLVLVGALAGCASTPAKPVVAYTAPAAVAWDVTMAAPQPSAEAELQQLARVKTNPALLRRAFLALQLQRPADALEDTSAVLYGPTKASTNEESFARYLRAEAFAQQGMPERGQFDRERAGELASDFELQRRLRSAKPLPEAAPAAIADVDLVVADRKEWQAKTANRRNMDPMGSISRLTIHHSAMALRDTRPNACAAQIRRIQTDHMDARGYGDIGYHYLIDPSGRIWAGRDLRWQGAHASGDNNVGNIGICLLGNFMPGRKGHKPSPAQIAALERLMVQLLEHHKLDATDVFCHSHFKNTECPGELMEPVLAQLIRKLQRKSSSVAQGSR